jgi:hypothetical protein
MARTERSWTVTPHSAIEKLSQNLWAVTSAIPGVPMNRRMCVIKRSNGELDFFHAVPLDDATLAEVKAWGTPTRLVIGHDNHGVDAHAFRDKLGLKLFGPKENAEGLRARWGDVGTLEDIPKDAVVQYFSCAGTKRGDATALVHSGGQASLLFSDAFMNIRTGPFSMRLAGFTGGPKIPFVFRTLFVKDKAALKTHLDKLAGTEGLAYLVPCHGDLVSQDAAAVLRKAVAAA